MADYSEPTTLQLLQKSIAVWQNETFPHSRDPLSNGWNDPFPTFSHLAIGDKSEIIELGAALTSYDKDASAKELADCFILLMGIASLIGVDMYEAVNAKMVENRNREWGEPDENGVIRHVPKKSSYVPERGECLYGDCSISIK